MVPGFVLERTETPRRKVPEGVRDLFSVSVVGPRQRDLGGLDFDLDLAVGLRQRGQEEAVDLSLDSVVVLFQ